MAPRPHAQTTECWIFAMYQAVLITMCWVSVSAQFVASRDTGLVHPTCYGTGPWAPHIPAWHRFPISALASSGCLVSATAGPRHPANIESTPLALLLTGGPPTPLLEGHSFLLWKDLSAISSSLWTLGSLGSVWLILDLGRKRKRNPSLVICVSRVSWFQSKKGCIFCCYSC